MPIVTGSSDAVDEPSLSNGEHTEKAGMDSLDVHLLVDVLVKAGLTSRQLCALSRLSSRWRSACASPLLWRKVVVHGEEGGNLYGAGLEQMQLGGRCKETEELTAMNIHVLERPNPWIHHGLELFMTSCSSSLTTLRLEFMWELPFADRLLAAIMRLGPALQLLDVTCSNCFFTDQALAALLRGCPAVRHFLFSSRSTTPIHGLSDSLLWQIAKKWPLLESLAFNAGLMSENGVFALADCQHLRSLALHGYRRGVFESAKTTADGQRVLLPSIEQLSFVHRMPTPGELRRIVHMCPKLTSVHLHNTTANEAGNADAAGLAVVLSSEFPSIACVRQTMAPEPTTYDLVAIAKRIGIHNLDKY